jgi:predicted ATPase
MLEAGAEPVRLRTLGGLALAGAPLSRPKPLLVLAYVALEGRQARRHLAELFFADADHPLQSLATVLSRLRTAVGPRLEAGERTVEARLDVDTAAFLAALDRHELEAAEALYRGPFLEGVEVDGVGVEIEEWIYRTREFLADQLREARLRRAERAAAAGRVEEAGAWGEAAWSTAGAPDAEAPQLVRLHTVLLAAGRLLAAQVAQEARGWGVTLATDAAAVRTRLASVRPGELSGLPREATGFVGRSAESASVREALLGAGARVVTLVGPGGVGKSRLALRVATELATEPDFVDGTAFVVLEDLADASRVPSRVANALGVALDDVADVTRLARALRERRALVVLDNAEHVLSSVGELVSAAASAPGLRWLVTSRERLQVSGERVVPLGGLSLPPVGTLDPAVLEASEAVALFLQRSRRYGRGGGDAHLADAVRICRAVGGWPLALEIAASLTRAMSFGEVATELEHRLDLLTDDDHDGAERHRSVLGAIESTWARLHPGDRDALERLAAFRGGFGRLDAEQATGVTVTRIARLIDRALLRPAGTGRFELHPLVWRYARDRLEERTDAPDILGAHARHYLALVAAGADELGGSGSELVAARLEQDHANLRDAWLAAVRRGEDAVWGGAALGFGRYLEAVSRYREGAEWLAEARQRARLAALDDDIHAVVALHEGRFLARLARFDDAAVAVAPAVMARDPQVRAAAHEALAHTVELWRGRYAAAGRHLREAEVLYRELGDRAGVARCTFVLANIAWIAGEWDEAVTLLTDARDAFRGLADRTWEVITMNALGVAELDRGDARAARSLFERALARAEGVPNDHLRSTVEVSLAHARLHVGDLDGLDDVLARGLAVFERVGDDPWVAETASYAARVAARTGRSAAALAHLRLGLEAGLRISHVPALAEVLVATADLVAAEAPEDAAALHGLVLDHPGTYANTRQASLAALAALGRGRPAVAGTSSETLLHPGWRDVEGAVAPSGEGSRRDAVVAAATALLYDGELPSGANLAERLRVDVPGTDSPTPDAPGTDAPGTDAAGADVPGADVPVADAAGTDVPIADVPLARG